ncbi:MAG: inorganic phosphate transporter [Planctomycetes bacterium]|nr:inorganic phosphate transporter [Planctomycetota bacterium]
MTSVILIIAVFWLAYSNGANDNFKGVATLYGSATTGYGPALKLATISTLAGSVLSLLLASTLAKVFSGNGLVPPALAGDPSLLIAVGAAAAVTIMIATLLGMPTSTTHALTGALLGVSVVAGGAQAPIGTLWTSFFLPLLVSPLLAIAGASVVYPALRAARHYLGVSRETCVCVGTERAPVLAGAGENPPIGLGSPVVTVSVADAGQCIERYEGRVVGLDAQTAVNGLHYFSAAAVCFARAVNDTPKIAALLLAGGFAGGAHWGLGLVAAAMALGGWLNSRRVAETMSRRITELNAGQGLTGNLVTAALVLGASHLGVPVSTTHVSCGSLFGIGFATGAARWKTVGAILLAWATTLPCGALLGAAAFWVLTQLGGL